MKLDKKKKKMLTIAVSGIFVLIIGIMLFRNYRRARNAEDVLNSAEHQEAVAEYKEFQQAAADKKKEILNATMTENAAKTFAQNFWAEAKGVTNKAEKQRISEMVLGIATGADLSRISAAYASLGLGRGGRSFVEQVKYELTPQNKWSAALNHLAQLSKDMIN